MGGGSKHYSINCNTKASVKATKYYFSMGLYSYCIRPYTSPSSTISLCMLQSTEVVWSWWSGLAKYKGTSDCFSV